MGACVGAVRAGFQSQVSQRSQAGAVLVGAAPTGMWLAGYHEHHRTLVLDKEKIDQKQQKDSLESASFLTALHVSAPVLVGKSLSKLFQLKACPSNYSCQTSTHSL